MSSKSKSSSADCSTSPGPFAAALPEGPTSPDDSLSPLELLLATVFLASEAELLGAAWAGFRGAALASRLMLRLPISPLLLSHTGFMLMLRLVVLFAVIQLRKFC